MNESLEQQILNPREQELLASIRRSTKIPDNTSALIRNSLKDSNTQIALSKSKSIGDKFLQIAAEQDKRKKMVQQVMNLEMKKNCNQKKLSNNSYKILIEKLERNLNDNLNDIDRDGQGQLTFPQLGRLFTVLEIFKGLQYNNEFELEEMAGLNLNQEVQLHDLAWRVLCLDESGDAIDVKKVFCLFRIAMDPVQLAIDKQSMLIREYLEKIDGYRKIENNIYYKTSQSYDIVYLIIVQFCTSFRDCTQSRLANTKIGYLKPLFAQNLIQSYQNTLTFKPHVDQVSEALQHRIDPSTLRPEQQDLFKMYSQALNLQNQENDCLPQSPSEQQLACVEQLLRKHEQNAIKKQAMAQEREEAELLQCTFKPRLNGLDVSQPSLERLYSYKTRYECEQITRDAEEQKEYMMFAACTFQPETIEAKLHSEGLNVKSFDKTVQRMRMALDLNNQQKQKVNHIPRGEGYSKSKDQPFLPPRMLSRQKQTKEQPILQINVNMGGGKVGRLSLKREDDPIKAVKNFAKIWGINKEDISDLLSRVNDEMLKIEEEDQQQEQ